MKKRPSIRIVEITVHRSKKNGRLGHAVALLFPCSHHKYLGLTLHKGDEDSYKTSDCKIIRVDNYDVMDKEVCKLCPLDDCYLDRFEIPSTLDDFADVLEAVDDDF